MPYSRTSVLPGVRHKWLHPFYLIVAFGFALCATVIMATAWMLWEQHDAAIQTAGVNLRNQSQAVAEQADLVIKSVEVAEDRLLDHLAFGLSSPTTDRLSISGSKQLHGVMRDIITGMSEAYALLLVDAKGNLVNFSNEFPIPTLNFADRQVLSVRRRAPRDKKLHKRDLAQPPDQPAGVFCCPKTD